MTPLDGIAESWARQEREAAEIARPIAADDDRFGFVGRILRTCGVEDQAAIDAATRTYAMVRNGSWHTALAPGELHPDLGAALVQSTANGIYRSSRALIVQPTGQIGELALNNKILDPDASPADQDLSPRSTIPNFRELASNDRPAWRDVDKDTPLNTFAAAFRQKNQGDAERQARHITQETPFSSENQEKRAHFMLAHALRQYDARAAQAAFNRFTRHLNADAIKLTRSIAMPDAQTYNWLVGDGDPGRATYRQQAMRTYPLLAKPMMQDSVTRQIDAGNSPARAIAETAARPAHVAEMERGLNRLQGVTWQRAGRPAFREPTELAKSLTETPKTWLPRSRQEFASFQTVFQHMKGLARATGQNASDLMRQTGGDWHGWAERFDGNPGRGVGDLVQRFHDQVLTPVVCRHAARYGVDLKAMTDPSDGDAIIYDPDLAYGELFDADGPCRRMKQVSDAIFGTRGPGAIMEASRKWHQELPRINEALQDPAQTENISWPALSEPWQAPNGLTVVPLTSRHDLAEEGRRLSHCVGGYTRACLGGLHVVSIRDAEGRSISTAALNETDDPAAPLVLDQHYGANNKKPTARAEAALKGYTRMLKQNEVDWDSIAAGRDAARNTFRQFSDLEVDIGYNPQDKAWNEKAFQVYRRYMTGPARKARNLDEFLEVTGLGQSLQQSTLTRCEEHRWEQSRHRMERQRDAARWGGPTPSPAPSPTTNAGLFSEMTRDAFDKLSDRQKDIANPLHVTPGEGIFRRYKSSTATPALERAQSLTSALRTQMDIPDRGGVIGYLDRATRGPSGTFVRAVLEQASDRVIVADTLHEARAVRAVADEVSAAAHRGRPTLDTLIAGHARNGHPLARGDQVIDNVDTTVKATRLLSTAMRQRAPAGDDARA